MKEFKIKWYDVVIAICAIGVYGMIVLMGLSQIFKLGWFTYEIYRGTLLSNIGLGYITKLLHDGESVESKTTITKTSFGLLSWVVLLHGLGVI